MYVTTLRSVASTRFLEKGSSNVRMRQLIGHEDGARKTALHELTLLRGGRTATHGHRWDHQLIVTSGHGLAIVDSKEVPLRPGVVLLVQAGEKHEFLQKGRGPLKFLAVTPL